MAAGPVAEMRFTDKQRQAALAEIAEAAEIIAGDPLRKGIARLSVFTSPRRWPVFFCVKICVRHWFSDSEKQIWQYAYPDRLTFFDQR